MSKSSIELPDCVCPCNPITNIQPSAPTPNHSLYLSNLDDQKFLRFPVTYMYIFKKSVSLDALKSSLARVLVDYYPLAGRLRNCSSNLDDHEKKLEVDCNGEGALFIEAFMAISVDEILEPSKLPNESWKKLMYKFEAQSFLDVPPLIVQSTNLRCGGMILCIAISHCICDGIGSAQFLNAWAQLTNNPQVNLTIPTFHQRDLLKPQDPPVANFCNPGYTKTQVTPQIDLLKLIQSQKPLVPTSFTFNLSHVNYLKKHCLSSLKCTTFEVVAAHTWRSWIRSMNFSLPSTLVVKLIFMVNIRNVVNLPKGYYGNGFLLGCAESTIKDLVENNNLQHGVKQVQKAKSLLKDEEYVRSTIDLLEDKMVRPNNATSFIITQWSKLGLEEVDFGEGKPLHMGTLTSDAKCLFSPVIGGDTNAVRVLVSVPDRVVETFQYHMKESWEKKVEKI